MSHLFNWQHKHLHCQYYSIVHQFNDCSIRLMDTYVTIVYDTATLQQLIYIDGRINTLSNGIVQPYQGSSVALISTISLIKSFGYSSSYFHGWEVVSCMLNIRSFIQYCLIKGVFLSIKMHGSFLDNSGCCENVLPNFEWCNIDLILDLSVNSFAGVLFDTELVTDRVQQGLLFSSMWQNFFSISVLFVHASYYYFFPLYYRWDPWQFSKLVPLSIDL
jgi:hypothetical protein